MGLPLALSHHILPAWPGLEEMQSREPWSLEPHFGTEVSSEDMSTRLSGARTRDTAYKAAVLGAPAPCQALCHTALVGTMTQLPEACPPRPGTLRGAPRAGH